MSSSFVQLLIPSGYAALSPEDKARICNGAGPKGYGALVPDTMYALSTTEAANIHDYMYDCGTEQIHKNKADLWFFYNMVCIIMHHDRTKKGFRHRLLTRLRIARAAKYFLAVWWKGDSAFWSDPEDEPSEIGG